jgi:hypothetical protein
VPAVVENRHRQCIAAGHQLLVEDGGRELQRRLDITIYIIQFAALNTDTGIPLSVVYELEKGIDGAGGSVSFII